MMDITATQPSHNGDKDKTTGKFLPKNRAGKGNPHCKIVNDFRTVFLKTITPKDVEDMLKVILAQAIAGDTKSLTYLLDRSLGKATQNINVESSTLKTYLGINIDEV